MAFIFVACEVSVKIAISVNQNRRVGSIIIEWAVVVIFAAIGAVLVPNGF